MMVRRATGGTMEDYARRARWGVLLATLPATACAPQLRVQRDVERAAVAAPATRADQLPPPGRGSLRRDQFSVELVHGALRVKVTPLAEEIIRLAAPDTYERLHRLASSTGEEARRRSGLPDAALFLVSFFSYEPDVDYQPESVRLTHQGRQLNARAVVPLAAGWGRQRLRQQETQSAVYAFAGAIDYDLAITVRYDMARSDAWLQVIPLLDRERSRVRSREPPRRPLKRRAAAGARGSAEAYSGISYSLILR